ncbi:hypothetical protein [Castellaniella sp.]|uniref:hypothetical protein n=1 Tax=Castellaniella sp. TaxID=1955812 RepID=UPI002AFFC04E|nr:hypothetical protein [Castellaniella sp.]
MFQGSGCCDVAQIVARLQPIMQHRADSVIEAADAAIAAIALESGFSVTTRDVSPFLATGVNVINPWEDQE